jgi:translocation and assembly module TamB
VIALALVLVLGAVIIVKSSWGTERVRQLVLSRLNASLAGQIEVQRLAFPGRGVAADGIRVRDPSGQLVGEVGHLDVRLSLWGLLRHRLHIFALTIDHPVLHLRRDSAGATNLARAVASKNSARPVSVPGTDQGTRGASVGWSATVDALSILDGIIDVQDASASLPAFEHLRLLHVDLRASGFFRGPDRKRFALHTRLEAGLAAPLAAPLGLALDGEGYLGETVPTGDGSLEITLGKNAVRLSGQMNPKSADIPEAQATVTIDGMHVLPSLIQLLVPAFPLKVALNGSATATWDGASGLVAAKANLVAAQATLAIRAFVRPRRPAIELLSLRARGIDLGTLVEQGPSSNLSLNLDAHGEGRTFTELRGAASLHVPPGRLGGYPVGPIDLRVDAQSGHYKLIDLLAVLPGLNITGAGEAVGASMNLHLAVDLRDLGTAVRSVGKGEAGRPVSAAGRGHLAVTAAGPVRAPSLQATGHFYGLAWQDTQASELHVRIDMPEVRRPLACDLSLKMPRIALGDRQLLGLVANLRAKGPRFSAKVDLASPEAFHLSAAGDWRRKPSDLVLKHMVVASRQLAWHLGRPARISWNRGVFRLIDLDLRAEGGQVLRLDLRKEAEQLDGDLTVSALDLAAVPASLLPRRTKLAGRLGAEIHLHKHAGPPTVNASLALAQGHVGAFTDLSLLSNIRLRGGRVSGHWDAAGLGAKVAGRFDVPLAWPPRASSAVLAELSVSHVDMGRLTRAVRSVLPGPASPSAMAGPSPRELGGQASGHLRLAGTVANPEFTMDAKLQQVHINGVEAGDVAVRVEGLGRKPLTAKLELGSASNARQIAGTGVVEFRSDAALGLFLDGHVSGKTLLATPMHLHVALGGLDLALLAAAAGYHGGLGSLGSLGELAGTGRLVADFDGTPAAPHGKLDLVLSRVSSAKFPATDGDLRVSLDDHDVRAGVRVMRKGTSLLSIDAGLYGAAMHWREPAALADASLDLHATLGPLDLQRAGLTAETDSQPPRALRGRLVAQADITGTVRAPDLNLRFEADALRVDDKSIGQGLAVVSYGGRTLRADVALHSANGGALHVTGSADGDLGYPAVLRLDPRQLPIEAHLEAHGFDLSGLSGNTANLRSIGGQLFAGVDVSGTLSDPRPSGSLEWKDGAVTVTGMGEYNHVHLLLHGDRDQLVIEELRAKSGDGQAHLSGKGNHLAQGGYFIHAGVDLDRFPAYADGQVLGTVSLKASAETHVSLPRVRSTISIASTHVTVSGAKRKHLQKLAQPQDVVLVEEGKPLNRAQAKKLAEVDASVAGASKADKAKAAASPPAEAPASVVLLVNAPRNVWVSGSDVNVELGLQPGFRVEMADGLHVYGEVLIKRGRIEVVGKRFDLKADSSLRFSGPADAAELNVTARYVAEQENVTVIATVKGSPDHLQTSLESPNRPDLTDSQLYTLIVTGRLGFGGGGGASPDSTTTTGQAASLVGGLLAGQLQQIAANKLPLDVLSIEGGSSLGTGKLEAGKYLTSDLYVGYVGRLGADPALLQNTNAVHLEYELGRHWSFQGEYGDAKTGSADLMWTKHY